MVDVQTQATVITRDQADTEYAVVNVADTPPQVMDMGTQQEIYARNFELKLFMNKVDMKVNIEKAI